MKKIMLFIIVTIVTFSAPKTSNNQNNDKSIIQLQIQIKELERRIDRQNEEYLKLKEEVEKRIGLTYSIDQIYSTASSHYNSSVVKIEELYSKSFDNYDKTLDSFLGFLGILMTIIGAIFAGFKIYDSKKYKEMKEEILENVKSKKEEIEKNHEIRFKTMIECTKEITDSKLKELEGIKKEIKTFDFKLVGKEEEIKEILNKKIEEELGALDKKIDLKFGEKWTSVELKLEETKKENVNKLIEDREYLKNEMFISIKNEVEYLKEELKSNTEKYIDKNFINKLDNINTSNSLKENIENLDHKEEKYISLFNKGDYEAAIIELKKNNLDDSDEKNYWIGLSYFKLFNYKEAIEYLEKIKLRDDFNLNYYKGLCYLNNKNYQNAILFLKKSIDLSSYDEENYLSRYYLAVSYYSNREYSLAKKFALESFNFTKLEEEKHYINYLLGVSYYMELDYKNAEYYLKEALKNPTQDYFNTNYWLAQNYLKLSDNENAIYYLKEAYLQARVNNEKHLCVHTIGNLYFEKNDFNEAKVYLKEALSYPSNKELEIKEYKILSKIAFEEKDYIKAKEYVDEAIVIDNQDLEILNLRKEINKKLEEIKAD